VLGAGLCGCRRSLSAFFRFFIVIGGLMAVARTSGGLRWESGKVGAGRGRTALARGREGGRRRVRARETVSPRMVKAEIGRGGMMLCGTWG
jgi:hypothetical protein